VNGQTVYTRKTTGKPYTHAIVAMFPDNTYRISNCSAKGIESLQRVIEVSPAYKWVSGGIMRATEHMILPIINNAVILDRAAA
jgi:aspartate oxidase